MKFSRADNVTISLREKEGGRGGHETLHRRSTERMNAWMDGWTDG